MQVIHYSYIKIGQLQHRNNVHGTTLYNIYYKFYSTLLTSVLKDVTHVRKIIHTTVHIDLCIKINITIYNKHRNLKQAPKTIVVIDWFLKIESEAGDRTHMMKMSDVHVISHMLMTVHWCSWRCQETCGFEFGTRSKNH